MKDKNSKAYKKARKAKALAFGASVRKAQKELMVKRKFESQARALDNPTERALKAYTIRRKTAMNIMHLIDNGLLPDTWANAEEVKFVQKFREEILNTPATKHYLYFKAPR